MRLALDSTVDLEGGVSMPRLGLGTYRSEPGAEVERSVETALRAGYRLIDTAALYGNEEGVAAGIKASGIPREDVFIGTKVWNDDQGYQQTRAAFERSLERLDTDYIDLYLIHWPKAATMEATWRAMEELLAEGRTRAIGVCNFLPHHLDVLLGLAEVPPAVDQVEFHPWLQSPSLQAYLTEHDIELEAWAPAMRGHAPEDPELSDIAQRLGVTPTQVALRWILQLGHVVIPKSVHAERIAENADLFGFELTDEDMARIDGLDRGSRFGPDPDVYAWLDEA